MRIDQSIFYNLVHHLFRRLAENFQYYNRNDSVRGLLSGMQKMFRVLFEPCLFERWKEKNYQFIRFYSRTKSVIFIQINFFSQHMINKPSIESNSVPHPTASVANGVQGDIAYMPSKYSKAFNNYSRNQIKAVVPFIAQIARTCSHSSLYPICKVLKAISKIYMLNEIQIIFLAYLIRETEWDFKDKTIFHNAENVQDIVCYSIDNLDYKRIILYLMVTAFTVKFYLNQNTGEILEEISKRCPNFKQIFQSWNKKHSAIITKINPRTLNIVYKKLYSSAKEDKPDFNMMVDAIIQISPAYNPQKQNQQKQKKASENAKQKQVIVKKQQPLIKHDKSGFIAATPAAMFANSQILNMVAFHHQIPPQNAGSDLNANFSGLNPFMPCKSDRLRQDYLGILGSSLIGGIEGSNYDLKQFKQQDDCGELVVGLHDGQSQQNIVFEQKTGNNNANVLNTSGFQLYAQNNQAVNDEQPFHTSVITLSKRVSAGRDSFGTSQILIGGSIINNNSNFSNARKQASIINLQLKADKNQNQIQ